MITPMNIPATAPAATPAVGFEIRARIDPPLMAIATTPPIMAHSIVQSQIMSPLLKAYPQETIFFTSNSNQVYIVNTFVVDD